MITMADGLFDVVSPVPASQLMVNIFKPSPRTVPPVPFNIVVAFVESAVPAPATWGRQISQYGGTGDVRRLGTDVTGSAYVKAAAGVYIVIVSLPGVIEKTLRNNLLTNYNTSSACCAIPSAAPEPAGLAETTVLDLGASPAPLTTMSAGVNTIRSLFPI